MNLFISFSGGETSAYMTLWCMENIAHEYDEVKVIFANTGQENEETLRFVDDFSKHYGIDVIWLEADVYHDERKGTGHKAVSYETASREGEPFKQVIKKYGIPNQSYPHCTRELKLAPMQSYIKSLGWINHHTAIGIRADEIDRMSAKAKENGLIYPLVGKKPMTKPMVNQFWTAQPFRLNLKGYQGNCKWCWKKSLRKHLTILNENPEWYDFPEEMEASEGLSGHNVDGTHRVFFRNNLSTQDLKELAKQPFTPAQDDAQVYPEPDLFGHDLDVSNGCSESCEVDFEWNT